MNADDGKQNGEAAARPKGSGDQVQRANREARIKQALRENLKRRKQKSRATSYPAVSDETIETERGN